VDVQKYMSAYSIILDIKEYNKKLKKINTHTQMLNNLAG